MALVASVAQEPGVSLMSDSKPNHTPYLESTEKGKFAVYVFFTKEELEQLEFVCNRRRVNMAKWIRELVKEELQLEV